MAGDGRTKCMKKKSSTPAAEINLPVSKQTAGGVTGAIVGGAIAGPVGAVVGAVAGTMMGNRAAKGKTLVSSGVSDKAKEVVDAARAKLPGLKAAGKSVAKASSKPAVRSVAAKKGAATKKAEASKSAAKAAAKPSCQIEAGEQRQSREQARAESREQAGAESERQVGGQGEEVAPGSGPAPPRAAMTVGAVGRARSEGSAASFAPSPHRR